MASPIDNASAELEAKATAFVRDNRLPGLAAGVVHQGELVWSGVPGFANVFTGSSTYAVGRVGAEVVGLYNMTGRIQYDVLGNSHFLSQVISARIGYLF